jgi:hypothetical protein
LSADRGSDGSERSDGLSRGLGLDLCRSGCFDAIAAESSKAEGAELHLHLGDTAGQRRREDDTLVVGCFVSQCGAGASPWLLSRLLRLGNDRVEAGRTSVGGDWLWNSGDWWLGLCLGPRGLSAGASDSRVLGPCVHLGRGGLLGEQLFRCLAVGVGLHGLLESFDLGFQLRGCRSITERFDRLGGDFFGWLGSDLGLLRDGLVRGESGFGLWLGNDWCGRGDRLWLLLGSTAVSKSDRHKRKSNKSTYLAIWAQVIFGLAAGIEG